MTYKEVLAHYGTQTAIGDALGINQATVSAWGRGGEFIVPRLYQYELERITQGALKADPTAPKYVKRIARAAHVEQS